MTASYYLQPFEIHTHTHTNRHMRAHTVCADTLSTQGCCHGYIKAETANFDQLLTVMSETVETEKWRNKVLPSLPPFILIGSRDRKFPSCGVTGSHQWSSCTATGRHARSVVPDVIMRKLRDAAMRALRLSPQPSSYPLFTLFLH